MPVILRPHVSSLYSGDVVVRVRPAADDLPPAGEWLPEVVQGFLGSLHPDGPPAPIGPLVQSRPPAEVAALEAAAAAGPFPPLRSLNDYHRIWLRDRPHLGRLLVDHLAGHPGVDRAWQELTADAPSRPENDPLSATQAYLDDPPHGVGARRVSRRRGADGRGSELWVLEAGWRTTQVDLARRGLAGPWWGDDAGAEVPGDADSIHRANHGTGTLGVLAATDDTAGLVGLVPMAKVRLVSCWDRATRSAEHVADAIVAALGAARPGAVLLLEVQRGHGLPTEVEDPDLDAIRLAVSLGVTVIEPAGNGGLDLDPLPLAGRSLDPSAPDFVDSGAVMVGALSGAPPRRRPAWCNHGGRVDAYAQGEGVVTAGAGFGTVVHDVTALDGCRRDDSCGTSAAAAILAGVAVAVGGIERRRPGGGLHPVDLRAWFRQPPPPSARRVGPMPDLRRVARTPVPRSLPLPGAVVLPAPQYRPRSRPVGIALAVGHPQTSEGNEYVRPTANGAPAGDVFLPHPSGSNIYCLPGGTPTASATTTWIESWRHYSLAATLGVGQSPPFASFWWDYAGPAPQMSPPAGVTVQATSTVSFTYGAVPTPPAAPPGAQGHFDLYVWVAGVEAKAGELRRFHDVAKKKVDEFWVFFSNYRFPGNGVTVEVRFITGSPSTPFADWLAGHRPANGQAPPWYAKTSYGY